jgi:hypothetical protein
MAQSIPRELLAAFNDPDQGTSIPWEEYLHNQDYLSGSRRALWLEFLLRAGPERFKKGWQQLPVEDRKRLGCLILKGYLFQPLVIPVWPEKKSRLPAGPLKTYREGRILRAESLSEINSLPRYYYPLAHNRLWPVLLPLIREGLFNEQGIPALLQSTLMMAARSGLKKIQDRLQEIQSHVLKERPKPVEAFDPPRIKKAETGVPKPPKARKKSKGPTGQMKLW